MITVRVRIDLPWLPRAESAVDLEEGCTVGEMLEKLGISRDKHGHLLVVVNGRSALPAGRLGDGDRAVVLPALCGG